GNGMLGVPGIAARTFAAVHRKGISVSLITQASSEHSICFGVPEAAAEGARASLVEEFQSEIARREIDGVEVRPGVATLVVVGLGMAGTPGIAARVFGALAQAGINVIAIAQGSSELNISVVVDARDGAREALDFAARHALANPILVDVTADDTSDTLKQALAAGMHLVLANKRPLTAHRKLYDELRALAEERGRRLLHETTVGAGLPI